MLEKQLSEMHWNFSWLGTVEATLIMTWHWKFLMICWCVRHKSRDYLASLCFSHRTNYCWVTQHSASHSPTAWLNVPFDGLYTSLSISCDWSVIYLLWLKKKKKKKKNPQAKRTKVYLQVIICSRIKLNGLSSGFYTSDDWTPVYLPMYPLWVPCW